MQECILLGCAQFPWPLGAKDCFSLFNLLLQITDGIFNLQFGFNVLVSLSSLMFSFLVFVLSVRILCFY